MRELFEILTKDLLYLNPELCCLITNFFAATPTTTLQNNRFAPHEIVRPSDENSLRHMKKDQQRDYFIFLFNEFIIKQRDAQFLLLQKQKEQLLKNSQAIMARKTELNAELIALFFEYLTKKTKLYVNSQSALTYREKQKLYKESVQFHKDWHVLSDEEWECVNPETPKQNLSCKR